MTVHNGGAGSVPEKQSGDIPDKRPSPPAASAASASNTQPSSHEERLRHALELRQQYWQQVGDILLTAVKRRRGTLELTDDERLLIDLGLGDIQNARRGMNPGDSVILNRSLLTELRAKGTAGCYYFSEWLAFRQQQVQLESELNDGETPDTQSYTGQLEEARRRILTRLTGYLTGLPGIPGDTAEMMRSGALDKAIIASGIMAIREPLRKNFLRRHRLWNLREQILSKAMARAENQSVLRLFEMLNEVYLRDWQAHHDAFQQGEDPTETPAQGQGIKSEQGPTPDSNAVISEMNKMRTRLLLMEAVDGRDETETILSSDGPKLSKPKLAEMIPSAQMFDRTLTEMPHIIIAPGFGRGFFAWETGCLVLMIRPLIGTDDSLATALAWMRVLTDRFQNGSVLKTAYEKAFPGAGYPSDFLADYRSWLCRLTKGDTSALDLKRRDFFREHIGPVLSGPILPPNLRNVGPQTMMAICRRLEKQLSTGVGDPALHRRLAMIYWQRDEPEAAGLQFNVAMQLAPDDGETLFSAGMFMRSRDDMEAANECFRFGAERATNTMWGIYCNDALSGAF